MGTVGPFNFAAGQSRKIALVYNFATTQKKMIKNLDKIQDAYDNQTGVFKPANTANNSVIDPIRPPADRFEVNISPNPMKNEAIVRFDNPRNEEFILQVFDLSGKLIMAKAGITGTQVTVERGDMAPGMYIIELRSGSQRTTAKLVVAE
ncbi:MAG: T9SS type A sorting domain-containing protein [Sphingobacteriales bacterium JAD_PAG50586_3]|nr:MAG: T9SS type A sorting domain-containing protein [Sphingobacteriales bacterium JAD_PAG50586_3]